jgi:hypothetical protein
MDIRGIPLFPLVRMPFTNSLSSIPAKTVEVIDIKTTLTRFKPTLSGFNLLEL